MHKLLLRIKRISAFSLVLSANVAFNTVNGQSVQWAHAATSPGYEWGNAITTDEGGNIYVSGQIEFTTHFDNGTNLSSWGSHDIFFVKYSPSGNLIWAKSAGGHRGDVSYGIGVDAQQNVYTVGEIEDTAYFSTHDSLVCVGSNDIYVSKYDANGNFSWAKGFGSAGNDKGIALAVNNNGDCYVTGYYSSGIDFGTTHLSPANSGIGDVYVLKLNSSGNVQWAKKGAGTDADHGHGITYDRNGNVYVVGYFTDQATFSGNTISTGNGVKSAFIAKYDQGGSLQWIKNTCCDTTDFNAVAVDEYGNIYAAGYFYHSLTIGSTTLNTAGDADILLVKYDPSGNVVWAKQAGGPYEDMANGITVDTIRDIVYITGQIDDHGFFDTRYVGAAGNRDVFIAGYDLNGNGLWAKPYGGVQRDIGFAVTCDHDGYLMTTGVFVDDAILGSYHLTGDSLYDAYVDKISPEPSSPPTTNASNLVATGSNCSDIQLTFNPGSGTGRIVVAHPGSLVSQTPVGGTIYNANSVYGSGDDIGGNNFVVYAGNGNSVTVTNLAPSTTYFFAVYEYSGNGAFINYQTSAPAQGSQVSGSGSFTFNVQASSNTLCEGDTISLTATGASNYQWSPPNGLSSTTGSTVEAHPQSSRIYTVTADVSGCQVSNTISVTVNSLPNVNLTITDSLCVNAAAVTLTGGTPTGGTYSGQGVAAGVLYPAVAGLGLHQVTYIYTDGNGCSNMDNSSIRILDKPHPNIGNDTMICAGNTIDLYSGAGYVSKLWMTGWTHSHIIIDSAGVGLGTKTVWVTVENNNGCFNSDTVNILFTICTGIESAGNNPALNLYPNPFSNSIYVNLDHIGDIYIYDVAGRLVDSYLNMNGTTAFGENLSAGLYSVVIYQKEFRSVFRISKE
jgi:hypothetical protein